MEMSAYYTVKCHFYKYSNLFCRTSMALASIQPLLVSQQQQKAVLAVSKMSRQQAEEQNSVLTTTSKIEQQHQKLPNNMRALVKMLREPVSLMDARQKSRQRLTQQLGISYRYEQVDDLCVVIYSEIIA
jgi:hypothetical protein